MYVINGILLKIFIIINNIFMGWNLSAT